MYVFQTQQECIVFRPGGVFRAAGAAWLSLPGDDAVQQREDKNNLQRFLKGKQQHQITEWEKEKEPY